MSRRARRVSAAAKVAFLCDPRSFRDGTRSVRLIETHFAWVFLTRRHAWKLKKPLRHWPLDYRTLERRRRGCRAELLLNRRLAPHVYLDVVPLTTDCSGRLALDGRGRVIDWLVKMRRLPATRMLDSALAQGSVKNADLARVIAVLAEFYARARRVSGGPAAYLARLRRRVGVNQRVLGARAFGLDPVRVREVTRAQLACIAALGDLLRERAARVVDGHGDLRPEHVYLGRPACVIDCLEFSAGLRVFDPAEEVAFLAVECERMGAPHVARRLIEGYRKASGDEVPEALVQLYMSQRATTRAKISAWRLRDPEITDRTAWRRQAQDYLAQAQRHIRRAQAELMNQSSQNGA